MRRRGLKGFEKTGADSGGEDRWGRSLSSRKRTKTKAHLIPDRAAVDRLRDAFLFKAVFLVKTKQRLLAGQNDAALLFCPGVFDDPAEKKAGIPFFSVRRVGDDREKHQPFSLRPVHIRIFVHFIGQIGEVARHSADEGPYFVLLLQQPEPVGKDGNPLLDGFFAAPSAGG